MLIPRPLLATATGSPLAVGLYALIGRLFLVAQAPVPLSEADLHAFDPALRRGAVVRALARLVQLGYLVADSRRGHKARYTPAWGLVNGTARPWQPGAPKLGRPAHIPAARLDRSLLDLFLGRLSPCATAPATVARYVSAPLLTLREVGGYALALERPIRPLPALRAWGLLDASGHPLPPPPATELLALASQRALIEQDGVLLTASGYARLGIPIAETPALPPAPRGTPLVYVPPTLAGSLIPPPIGGLIGGLIGEVIGQVIGQPAPDQPLSTASGCAHPLPLTCDPIIPASLSDPESDQAMLSDSSCAGLPVIQEEEEQASVGRSGSNRTAPTAHPHPHRARSSAQPSPAAADPRMEALLHTLAAVPPVRARFATLNPAAAAASYHELAAAGAGVGAVFARWKEEPPEADAWDQQAARQAPGDWPAAQVATLASFLRDDYPADEALELTLEWTCRGARQQQERELARAERRSPPQGRYLPDAPRRSERAEKRAQAAAALARARAVAPPDFDDALITILAEYFVLGVTDVDDAIVAARDWHARLAAGTAFTGARR